MPRLKRKSVLQPRKWHWKKTLKSTSTPITDSIVQMDNDPGRSDILELPQNTHTEVACADFGTQTVRCHTDLAIQTEENKVDSANCDHSYCVIYDSSQVENLCYTRLDDCCSDKLNCGFLENSYEGDSIVGGDDLEETPSDTLNTAFLDISSTEHIVETLSFESFCAELQKEVPHGYQFLKKTSKVMLFQTYSKESLTVKLVVTIYEDFTCTLTVHSKDIPRSHEIWDRLPVYFHNINSVSELCRRIGKYHVCAGNPDKDFTSLVPVGAGLTNNLQETMAYHEGNFDASSKNTAIYHGTIRSIKCTLLVNGERCKHCTDYRKCLKKRKARILERETSNRTFSHTTFKHSDMTRANLLKKLSEQKSEINSLQKKVWQLQREMKNVISKEGVELHQYENLELKDLMNSCEKEFEKSFPDATCRQRIFWEQQSLMASKKDARGMRWHPMLIKWCLLIRQKSAQAYNTLRDSGFISLPSTRTLFDYSHYLKSSLGLQKDVIECARKEAEKYDLYSEEWRKYVGLLFDEIKIREDLVYDKHSGELIGYCNLDSVANEMMEFDNLMNNNNKKSVAKFVLVVMIRSTASKWCFPICGFATKSITADFLYPIIWRTVSVVEKHLRLKVLFFTCDGATPNRRFFGMHRVGDEDVVFKTVNPHDFSRDIYFVSDVPHLLKTARNNFSNSFSHKRSRMLWKGGKDISWAHIVRLFQEHCELSLYNPCPKLSRDHVDLTSFNYMKVNLAAQVLSESVAVALEELYGPEVSETVKFVRHMNQFFDILNVRSIFEGRNKRNDNLNVFRSVEDERLTYLLDEFLGYIDEWEDEVNNRPGNFTAAQKATMRLSFQTVVGMKMSVHSICSCIKFLLGQGASFVLTHTFNQDPLEQHFGHYRHRGGGNNNPSVYEVQSTMNTLRTVSAQALPVFQGNIRQGPTGDLAVDNTNLQRRKPTCIR